MLNERTHRLYRRRDFVGCRTIRKSLTSRQNRCVALAFGSDIPAHGSQKSRVVTTCRDSDDSPITQKVLFVPTVAAIDVVHRPPTRRLHILGRRPVMLATPKALTLTIPSKCRHCDAPGSVKLLTKMTATDIAFRWFCTNCDRGWPATVSDGNTSIPQHSAA